MWRGNLGYGAHTYVREQLLTIYQIILPLFPQITVQLESRELQRQTISQHRSRLLVSVIHYLWQALYPGVDDASHVQHPRILFDQRSDLHLSRTCHPDTPGSGRSLVSHLLSSFRKAVSRIKCGRDRRHRVVPVQRPL